MMVLDRFGAVHCVGCICCVSNVCRCTWCVCDLSVYVVLMWLRRRARCVVYALCECMGVISVSSVKNMWSGVV